MTAGTRLTGWATLLVGYATVLLGALPDRGLPLKSELPWFLAATGLCGLAWILASALVRAQRRARLRKKTWRRRYEPWPEPAPVPRAVLGPGLRHRPSPAPPR
ncbi:hypothetical protein [Streptomyces thioluteus]|uniref:hypothetical protein n=1 Tax=Streptomyces thioluteus TaxID=66431 RepID=UPI0031E83975